MDPGGIENRGIDTESSQKSEMYPLANLRAAAGFVQRCPKTLKKYKSIVAGIALGHFPLRLLETLSLLNQKKRDGWGCPWLTYVKIVI